MIVVFLTYVCFRWPGLWSQQTLSKGLRACVAVGLGFDPEALSFVR